MMKGRTKKPRESFVHSLFPQKGDGKKRAFYKLVSLISVLAFLGCVFWLAYEYLLQPSLNDRSQDEIRNVYHADLSSGESASSGPASAPGTKERIGDLQKINPDIIGWITVPRTGIDLPVVQATAADPEFYLTHDYRRQHSSYGCVFADYRAPASDPAARTVILYGHSLISGRMFTQLKDYKSLAFYKTAPVITFDTGNGSSDWVVFATFVTNTLTEQGKPFDYIKTAFTSDSDFLNFVYQIRIRSFYNTDVSLTAKDKILLLSTCSYEFKDFREVVAARKVRDGETFSSASIRTSYNSKTLYPDCWYQKNGGKKPEWPATYEEAEKEGLLSWQEK